MTASKVDGILIFLVVNKFLSELMLIKVDDCCLMNNVECAHDEVEGYSVKAPISWTKMVTKQNRKMLKNRGMELRYILNKPKYYIVE